MTQIPSIEKTVAIIRRAVAKRPPEERMEWLLVATAKFAATARTATNLAAERDRLVDRLRRGEQVVYQALQWMLNHGGAGDPMRIRLKNWRSGRPDDD